MTVRGVVKDSEGCGQGPTMPAHGVREGALK